LVKTADIVIDINMRIENVSPSFYIQPPPVPQYHSSPAEPGNNGWQSSPAAIVDISPRAWEAYAQNRDEAVSRVQQTAEIASLLECAACDSRRYVDQSDDPSVSFQTPTSISPGQSAAMVMAHEQEHVSNEQAKAGREGREVVSQTVSVSMAMCPECGRAYASGGQTRTVTKGSADGPDSINDTQAANE
jgi:hypothetical protein